MFDAIRSRVLRVFRVPHDPEPPTGAPGSIRVFRAGRNFYKLRLFAWGIGQVGAIVGIIFSLTLLERLEEGVEQARREARQPAPAPVVTDAQTGGTGAVVTRSPKKAKRSRQEPSRGLIRRIADQWPAWLLPLLTVLEGIGILLYLLQIPVTYAMARLDYELRWYIVTDRSLRIRAGLAAVQETTMSFANVQQVAVSQGPLQRILGIADLRVQSAGGGGDDHPHTAGESLHTGTFHGVDNASEIRDLILDRLRAYRQAGLGDPDDAHSPDSAEPPPLNAVAGRQAALEAAHELLDEARALRQALR